MESNDLALRIREVDKARMEIRRFQSALDAVSVPGNQVENITGLKRHLRDVYNQLDSTYSALLNEKFAAYDADKAKSLIGGPSNE